MLAVSKNDLEPPHPTLDVHEIGEPVKLIKGASASDKDVEIVKTLIEVGLTGAPLCDVGLRAMSQGGGFAHRECHPTPSGNS